MIQQPHDLTLKKSASLTILFFEPDGHQAADVQFELSSVSAGANFFRITPGDYEKLGLPELVVTEGRLDLNLLTTGSSINFHAMHPQYGILNSRLRSAGGEHEFHFRPGGRSSRQHCFEWF